MDIQTALDEGIFSLKKNCIESAKLDAEILMSQIIKKDRKYIILNLKKSLSSDLYRNYKSLINLRSKGKPIAYLIKKKSFWKFDFKLNDEVLIPRPDTEIIIEQALDVTKFKSKLRILDIGVGSGCILLSILKERKNFRGVGIDISKKCTDISKINTLNLGLNKRVKIFKTDIDNLHYGKYDLIISNPPYIKNLDIKYLNRDVREFEPKLALDGGIDGISEIRKVINKSSELIKKGGNLVLEIAFDQKNKVKKLLEYKGYYINRVVKDYAGNHRCIVSTKK